MNNSSTLADFLRNMGSSWLNQLPLILACLACLVVALIKWRRATGPAVFVLLGSGYFLLLSLVMPMLFFFLPRKLEGDALRIFYEYINPILWSGLYAVGLTLFLSAVFWGRSSRQPDQPS